MSYLEKLAVKMTADDFVKIVKKQCIKDKQAAWTLFREGLDGNITKSFLRKCNLTKDIFTPDGKQIWHTGIYKEMDRLGLNEKTLKIKDIIGSALEIAKR